ncbi:toll-like receptor 2 [Pecten maximus]|uniref:toll-like receptor 2 n=1 Tax=Pecten maximus TaxID=6579 RepID=UPI0014581780|nr:toll-like receptor 2 [Pecten maximus]
MDNNHVFTIPGNTFSGLPKLGILSIDKINSQRLTIENNSFNSKSLQRLTLGSVQKDIRISDTSFDLCQNLKMLRFSGISFQKWTEVRMQRLFLPLKKLTCLALVKAGITLIPTSFLPRLQKLVYLDLSGNFISSWQSKTFQNASSLKTLILSSNQITHINESFFPDFLWKDIEVLDIAFNPFDCSCELYWFRKWLNVNGHKLKKYPKVYYCKSPSKYKDRRLVTYDPSYRECHPLPTLTIALIVTACVVVVFVGIAVVLYRNRWHIKYYIYLLHSKKDYEPLPGDNSFIYDAFVAYNSTDRVWVISELKEFLENKHGMKLCLHERDFSAGKLIVDNIIKNINFSRKVILVLTNEFAKSQWCQFETLMAQNRFFEQGASSLVLLMLENLSPRHLNGPLSMLLQSVTYIEWTKDTVGKDVFWKKLLDSLK